MPKLVVDNAATRVPSGTFQGPGSTDLHRRAKIVGRQLAYFGLAARKCSFGEPIPSAERASFTLVASNEADKEALFEWATEPDFLFSISFNDPAISPLMIPR
jgi:hypothetical protein